VTLTLRDQEKVRLLVFISFFFNYYV
jgi:hypothetical protein